MRSGTAEGRVVRVPLEQQGDLDSLLLGVLQGLGDDRLGVNRVARQQQVPAGLGDESTTTAEVSRLVVTRLSGRSTPRPGRMSLGQVRASRAARQLRAAARRGTAGAAGGKPCGPGCRLPGSGRCGAPGRTAQAGPAVPGGWQRGQRSQRGNGESPCARPACCSLVMICAVAAGRRAVRFRRVPQSAGSPCRLRDQVRDQQAGGLRLLEEGTLGLLLRPGVLCDLQVRSRLVGLALVGCGGGSEELAAANAGATRGRRPLPARRFSRSCRHPVVRRAHPAVTAVGTAGTPRLSRSSWKLRWRSPAWHR